MNICTHYGFGDYVVCYGLIKELARKDDITLFVRQHQTALDIDNIRRLYSTISNVTVSTDDPEEYDTTYIGFEYFYDAIKKNPDLPSPVYFYEQMNVPLNLLWDNFYFPRDSKKEEEVYYDMLGLKDNEEYVFVHEDPSRGFNINAKFDIRTIRPIDNQDVSVLDMLYVVEKSKEVHSFSSGIVPFIDQMNINHNNLNLHSYIRPLAYDQPILKLNWKTWR